MTKRRDETGEKLVYQEVGFSGRSCTAGLWANDSFLTRRRERKGLTLTLTAKKLTDAQISQLLLTA